MHDSDIRSWRFPGILKAVATSLQPARLVIALLIVTVLMLGGQIWDGITPATVSPEGLRSGAYSGSIGMEEEGLLRRAQRRWGDSSLNDDSPDPYKVIAMLQTARASMGTDESSAEDRHQLSRIIERIEAFLPLGAYEATVLDLQDNFNLFIGASVRFEPSNVYRAILGTVYDLPAHLWAAGQGWFLLIYGTFFLLVISIGGGALCRMEACQVSANERLTMREAMQHGMDSWWKFFSALIIPMILAGVVCCVLLLIGLIFMSIPILNILTSLLYGIVLLVGFLLVFILLGYLAGGTLLLPAVAVENCEGGDAMQRAYAYILNRPLHMLLYVITALVGLVLGYLVVHLLAMFTVNMTAEVVGTWTFNGTYADAGRLTSLFSGNEEGGSGSQSTWYVYWGGGLVSYWVMLVQYLVAGWICSYVLASTTRIYLLMRRACDGQDDRLIWWPGLIPGTLAQEPTMQDEESSDS